MKSDEIFLFPMSPVLKTTFIKNIYFFSEAEDFSRTRNRYTESNLVVQGSCNLLCARCVTPDLFAWKPPNPILIFYIVLIAASLRIQMQTCLLLFTNAAISQGKT